MKLAPLLARVRPFVPAAAVTLGIAVLVLWLAGVFSPQVPPTDRPTPAPRTLPPGTRVVTATATAVPVREAATGAISAVQEVKISSRVLARVAAMYVQKAGQRVAAGEVLCELEDADLQAAVAQAEAAQRAAAESRDQARRDLQRTRELHGRQIASDSDLERDTTRERNATADYDRATQAVAQTRAQLAFATIKAPIAGTIVDKLVDRGDTVAPGQLLMTLFDPTRMQLVASVREHLARRLHVGREVAVRIDALDLDCHGTVAEIVPQAAAGARAFDVKVTGPCPEGVFSGMFGRLFVDAGERQELRVPRAAVRSIGQIDQVVVVRDGGRLLRRFVVLGEPRGDDVCIESGLQAGEVVVADAAALHDQGVR